MASRIVDVDEHTLIRALRRPGDEVQFTRAIDKLAQADTGFARRLLELLLSQAPNAHEGTPRLGPDERVVCRAEQAMRVAPGNTRRIDLVLSAESLKLFIEVKLHSDYQPEQLRDYLRAIKPAEGQFLIAITRNVSRFREPERTSAGWLGVIRWAGVAAALRDLPSPGPVKEHWQLLLDVLEEDGDLGSSKLTADLVNAYAQSDEAYNLLTDFLEHIGGGLLQRLRAELTGGDASNRAAAGFASARKRPVTAAKRGRADKTLDHPEVLTDDEGLYLAFNIPADGPEVLWVGFCVNEEGAQFYTASGWASDADPPTGWEANWLASLARLKAQLAGQDLDADEENLYCQTNHQLIGFADMEDVPTALAQQADEDISRFVRSGMFPSPSA